MKKLYISFLVFASTLVVSCHGDLETDPYAALDEEFVLNNEEAVNRLLLQVYSQMQWHQFPMIQYNYLEEGPTDIFYEQGGGQFGQARRYQEWTWDANHIWNREVYSRITSNIAEANQFLSIVRDVNIDQDALVSKIAEARVIRAYDYYLGTKWYGDFVFVNEIPEEGTPPPGRTPKEEIYPFIEKELIEAAEDLPLVQENEYGKLTKGAALSILTKFYLNTRQWQKASDAAQKVIDLQQYSLVENYPDMFKVENDRNSEYIFVYPQITDGGAGNQWMALSRPPNIPLPGTAVNFAANLKYYDDFIATFEPEDSRLDLFIFSYTTIAGEEIQLLGNDDSRSFKFNDLNPDGATQGNDMPIIRYADILLSKAEALNELQGPNMESINLINQIRTRANASEIQLGDFDQNSLNDFILAERGREFYSEYKRRSDLIRHDKFFSQAEDRGISTAPFRLIYAIPQSELDLNPNLQQNPGY